MTTASEINQRRAKLSGLSRDRLPGDPAIDEARAELVNAQQRAAASAVLDGVELRNDGASPGEWIRALKPSGVPIGVVALEAVELLAYLVRLSDRPAELVAALRAQANRS